MAGSSPKLDQFLSEIKKPSTLQKELYSEGKFIFN